MYDTEKYHNPQNKDITIGIFISSPIATNWHEKVKGSPLQIRFNFIM
jgi:hypothetical protein